MILFENRAGLGIPLFSEDNKKKLTQELKNWIFKRFVGEKVANDVVSEEIMEGVKNFALVKVGDFIGRIRLTVLSLEFIPEFRICDLQYEIVWFEPVEEER